MRTGISPSLRPVPPGERYDDTSIALHWASAALILLNWLLGQFRFIAPEAARGSVLSTHILIGIAIATTLMARLAWRLGPGRRLAAEPGWPGRVAKAAHAGLYGLIGMTVLAGMSHALAHRLDLFGIVLTHGFDFWPHGPVWLLGRLHGKFADLLVILAGLHALAALAHHMVLGDGVLLRMAPALLRGVRRASG